MNIFGGNTGMTYGDVQRKRKLAEQLASRSGGTPKNVGEGLSAIGKALLVRSMNKKADKRDAELRGQFNDQFAEVAPNHQGLADLANSPYAGKAHQDVISALMKGAPNYARGGVHPGGMAVVGENGPEAVMLPPSSRVIPALDPYDQGGPASDPGYGGVQEGFMEPFEPDEYFLEEVGPEEFERYKGMNREQRLDYLNNPQNGFVPPAPDTPQLPDAIDANNSFDDSRAYQTAQSGPLDGISQPPSVAEDAVTNRSVMQKEMGQRDALNALSSILEEMQANPELLDSTHTLTGRAEMSWLRLRDRLGVEAWDIGPEGEKKLGDATAYKQQLLTQVNNYIKEITGATVGQGDETTRLMATQANEKDSPTQVIAKITNAMNLARLETARQKVMQRDGGEAPTDAELRGILKSRGRELYDLSLSEGLSPDEARMKAAQALTAEFGI